MKIATWNINSIKARMHALTDWIKKADPDIVCLQEIKTENEGFPYMEVEALGYNVLVHGQKSYNGVAILSKIPFEETRMGLPGDDTDEQARYAEAVVMGQRGPVRVASIYLPNGNPAPGPKYDYKLAWMERLRVHAQSLLPQEEAVVLTGDYNVIPHDQDTHDPIGWRGDAAFRPEHTQSGKRFLTRATPKLLSRWTVAQDNIPFGITSAVLGKMTMVFASTTSCYRRKLRTASQILQSINLCAKARSHQIMSLL
jgi:exodeoxyribonuclease-3